MKRIYSIWTWEPDYDEGGGKFVFLKTTDSSQEIKSILKSNSRHYGKIEVSNETIYFSPNELKGRGSLLDRVWFGGNLA